MRFQFILSFLALLGLVSAAKRNCRRYDVNFTACIDPTKPKPEAELADLIYNDALVKSAKTGLMVNKCMSLDTLWSFWDYKTMPDQNAGPINSACPKGWVKTITTIGLWRWRNKWDQCADVDAIMRHAIRDRKDFQFWYSTPLYSQITCRDDDWIDYDV